LVTVLIIYLVDNLSAPAHVKPWNSMARHGASSTSEEQLHGAAPPRIAIRGRFQKIPAILSKILLLIL